MSSPPDSGSAGGPAAADAARGVQDALAAAIKSYVALLEEGIEAAPYRAEHQVTLTEAALTASRILSTAQIELFELSIFESWHQLDSKRAP